MASPPYALGVYVGDPNGSDPAAQAQWISDYNSFVDLMGTTPQYLDEYIDQRQSISDWPSNASWEAWSLAQSSEGSDMTPVIGLPMTSTASSESADQQYQDWSSGAYDSEIYGMVQAWAEQGYTTQYWRPGWEMNLSSMPSYGGDDAQTQADWIAAFQHIYTVLHAAGAEYGVDVQVIWNPSVTNYSSAGDATRTLYPGDSYVDMIGADVYSDVYPYGDTNALYDWDASGQTYDSSTPVYTDEATWASDTVNLTHYYTDPASTQWSADGSSGHSTTLQELIDFAAAHGKTFVVPEAGAGNSTLASTLSDNATFVQWLSDTLQSAGSNVGFVNLWDSNGGGEYEFSQDYDGKPDEAAAWAKYFGAQLDDSAGGGDSGVGIVSADQTIGSGSDAIVLSLSEDAYEGDAEFTVSVDGVQVGGVLSITALQSLGQTETVAVLGNWGTGAHTVSIDFLNDNGGYGATDRNLYLDSATYDGSTVSGANLALYSSGTQSFVASTTAPPAAGSITTIGSGSDVLQLELSEDAWQGDANFIVTVNGVQVGGIQTATASHAAGQTQALDVLGDWGGTAPSVAVTFLNDAYGGTASTDRNLYVDSATYNDTAASTGSVALMSSGTQYVPFAATSTAPISLGSGSDSIVLQMSEDAYQGDAQFTISVDGVQIGGILSVAALASAGQTQSVTVNGDFGLGSHVVSVDFLNDNGGYGVTDRNLYVNGASIDGTTVSGASLSLYASGTQSFTATTSTTYVEGAAGGTVSTLGNDTVQIGTGDVTISATGPSTTVIGGAGAMAFVAHGGNDVITAGSGTASVAGSTGTLDFTAGSGAASVWAGAGAAVFTVIDGSAGGTLNIVGWSANDSLHLEGYQGSGVASQTVSGGNTQIVLTDNTRITLQGYTGSGSLFS